jgi:small subunit ribosomal protein S8
MSSDTLSRILTSIRNALRIKSFGVEVPRTRITHELAKLLLQEGLIDEVLESFSPCSEEKDSSTTRSSQAYKPLLFLRLKYLGTQRVSVITGLQNVSRSSLRIYSTYKQIPRILDGFGFVVISTSEGLITGHIAQDRKLGGEILCSVW